MTAVEVNVANPMKTWFRAKRSFSIVILNQGFKILGPQQNIKISSSIYLSNFTELLGTVILKFFEQSKNRKHTDKNLRS